MFWREVRGVLALGRDARRRGPSSLSLLPAVLGRRVRLDRPRKGRRPLDLVVARPLAVAEPLQQREALDGVVEMALVSYSTTRIAGTFISSN